MPALSLAVYRFDDRCGDQEGAVEGLDDEHYYRSGTALLVPILCRHSSRIEGCLSLARILDTPEIASPAVMAARSLLALGYIARAVANSLLPYRHIGNCRKHQACLDRDDRLEREFENWRLQQRLIEECWELRHWLGYVYGCRM